MNIYEKYNDESEKEAALLFEEGCIEADRALLQYATLHELAKIHKKEAELNFFIECADDCMLESYYMEAKNKDAKAKEKADKKAAKEAKKNGNNVAATNNNSNNAQKNQDSGSSGGILSKLWGAIVKIFQGIKKFLFGEKKEEVDDNTEIETDNTGEAFVNAWNDDKSKVLGMTSGGIKAVLTGAGALLTMCGGITGAWKLVKKGKKKAKIVKNTLKSCEEGVTFFEKLGRVIDALDGEEQKENESMLSKLGNNIKSVGSKLGSWVKSTTSKVFGGKKAKDEDSDDSSEDENTDEGKKNQKKDNSSDEGKKKELPKSDSGSDDEQYPDSMNKDAGRMAREFKRLIDHAKKVGIDTNSTCKQLGLPRHFVKGKITAKNLRDLRDAFKNASDDFKEYADGLIIDDDIFMDGYIDVNEADLYFEESADLDEIFDLLDQL